MHRPRSLLIAHCSLLTVVLTGSAAAITLVSVRDEIEIGRQAQAQLRKDIDELQDATVSGYVRHTGRELARNARGPNYPYSFSVANYREINAFALPGGPVWVHRGAIRAVRNESQFAGVLAHEVAHISQRHAADQLTKAVIANWGLGLLGAMLGSGNAAGVAQVAARFMATGAFLKFSRDHEREADQVGAQIMRRAGWDPRGMVELLQLLRQEAKRDPGSVEVFFSSHPSPQGRIEVLTDVVGKLRGGGRRDSDEFQAIRRRLERLQPAKSAPKR